MTNLMFGIIVADNDEFSPLEDFILKSEHNVFTKFGRKTYKFKYENNDVLAICCGIGKVNAAIAATTLIDMGCNIILNYGLSGGLSGVSREELVTPKSFIEHDFDLTGIGYAPCQKPSQEYIYYADDNLLDCFKKIIGNSNNGLAVTGDHFVCSKEESGFLKENFSAVSCDMETAAIAYTCNASNIPFAALRRISDDADDLAVENYREMNTSSNSMPYEIILEVIKNFN